MSEARSDLTERLRELLKNASAGGVVAATTIAKTLLIERPDCGFTLTELKDLVGKEATRLGIPVEFDPE